MSTVDVAFWWLNPGTPDLLGTVSVACDTSNSNLDELAFRPLAAGQSYRATCLGLRLRYLGTWRLT